MITIILLLGCLGKNQSGQNETTVEAMEILLENMTISEEKPQFVDNSTPEEVIISSKELPDIEEEIPERGMKAGDYLIELVLQNETPYYYDIFLSPDHGDNWYESSASIGTRPVLYYADEEYFILLADSESGQMDSRGFYANNVYVVFDTAQKKFKQIPIRDYQPITFRVIDNVLYGGNHFEESPNGSITIVDIQTGEIQYIYHILKGEETIGIEAWAPQVQKSETGELLVWLSEYNQQSYRIEGELLIPGEILPPESFYENPTLPIR